MIDSGEKIARFYSTRGSKTKLLPDAMKSSKPSTTKRKKIQEYFYNGGE